MSDHPKARDVFLASLLCVLFSSICCQAQSPGPSSQCAQPSSDMKNAEDKQIVAIDAVVCQVKTALADVQTKLANKKLPPLKSVTLTLQTIASKNGGLHIKLWIISIGHVWTKEKSQEVVIVLTPPSAGNPIEIATQTLSEELEDAIISAAEGVSNAGQGKIPLKLSSLSAELGFTVKGDTSVDANVVISPVTVEFKGDLSKTAVQKIKVVFETPQPKKPSTP